MALIISTDKTVNDKASKLINTGTVTKSNTPKRTMYFKDEGDYYTYKLTKDGQLTDPNEMYEFGTLQTCIAHNKARAKFIAQGFNAKPVFG